MTTTKLSQLLVYVVLGASLAASCGSVSPLSTDGAAGQGGTTGAAGQGGTTGAAGQGGTAGSAGQSGTTGSAGAGGTSGTTGDGTPDGGWAGTTGGAPATGGTVEGCHGSTQAECEASGYCTFFQAPACNGNPSFTVCYPSNYANDIFCAPAPPACSTLGEAACRARSDCRADECPTCMGKGFAHCAGLGDPPSSCVQPQCPVPCSQVTRLTDCEVRTDCHAVYQDPGNCGCADPGCCAKFSFCADGNSAKCGGTPVCKSAAPHCEGVFVVSYTDSCYEGCVEQADCNAYPP